MAGNRKAKHSGSSPDALTMNSSASARHSVNGMSRSSYHSQLSASRTTGDVVTGTTNNSSENKRTNVCLSRNLFWLALAVVGAGLSVAAYYILERSESSQVQVRYEGIADRALTSARDIVQRKRLGVATMADTVAWIQRNASDWPFVTVTGFESMANNIMKTSKARSLGLVPLVTPEQRVAFEDFAYDFFHFTRDPPFSNTTGVSPFGKGIWQNTPEGKKPVNPTGENTWGSPHKIFAPILQHSSGDKVPVLLSNINSSPQRGIMVDYMMDCRKEGDDTSNAKSCGVLTDMIDLPQANSEGPDAIMMEPIYPAQNPNTLVGFISSSVVWEESLENVFPEDVSGIDCVLRTDNQHFTFGIENGVAFVKGPGDLHDPAFDEYRESIELITEGDFHPGNVLYSLHIYPGQEFFDDYTTKNPIIGLVGALAITLVISLLFYLYDSFVRQEIDATQELLEAKRRFVRFVRYVQCVRIVWHRSLSFCSTSSSIDTAATRSALRLIQFAWDSRSCKKISANIRDEPCCQIISPKHNA